MKVAYSYFILATLLFGLQMIFWLITGAKYAWGVDPLMYVLPFNTSREIHINLLVVWLLLGFMGGTSYMIPEESDTELYSPGLAYAQFWLFAALGVAAVAGYLLGWTWGIPFTEQPFIIKVGIVVVALMFLFGMFFMKNLSAKSYMRLRYEVFFAMGACFVVGVSPYVYDFFTLVFYQRAERCAGTIMERGLRLGGRGCPRLHNYCLQYNVAPGTSAPPVRSLNARWSSSTSNCVLCMPMLPSCATTL